MHRKLFIFFLAVIFFGCKEDEDEILVYDIAPDFQLQVDTFFDEAERRGIIISKDNLIVKYGDPGEEFLCGSCNSIDIDARKQKIVIINDQSICWNNTPDKEALIFHELGHCLLGRRHLDNKFPNGDPVSIMVKNSIHLYSPCNYAIGESTDCNQSHKRAYYVDELFNTSTPTPYWSND